MAARPSRAATTPLVTVCRGCCCGTVGKHPGVDHAGQVADLEAGLGDAGRVRVSDCLDACAHSNVVVVGPSEAGRRAGARPTWLAGVLDHAAVADIVAWVQRGGPGVATAPAVLELMEFSPPRLIRGGTPRAADDSTGGRYVEYGGRTTDRSPSSDILGRNMSTPDDSSTRGAKGGRGVVADMAFDALADPVRREILAVLAARQECSAGDLSNAVQRVGRTAVSSHLRILRMAGLVAERRTGRFRYYSVNRSGPAQDVIRLLQELFQSSLDAAKAAAESTQDAPMSNESDTRAM